MAEDTPEDEKTEEPTARRLQKAREDGQLPRSQELGVAGVMISAMAAIYLFGGWFATSMAQIFSSGFVIDRRNIFSPYTVLERFGEFGREALLIALPLLVLTFVVAILASSAMGGLNWSWKAMVPKASKISPIAGLKRMFGLKSLVELAKSTLKFGLVASVLAYFVFDYADELMLLSAMPLQPALAAAGEILTFTVLVLTCMLVVIAAIDVPFQSYEFSKRMKMTKQEVKDEFKDLEGRPEVKAQIRRKQREMAEQRMMDSVKDADVVITNPEHFSVCLIYDPESDGAPRVIAKGVDHIALRIRNEAKTHGVVVIEVPPLARALYFTTDLDQAIPEELYYAVAQVIAYVFSLSSIRRDGRFASKPNPEIPNGFRFDVEGNPE